MKNAKGLRDRVLTRTGGTASFVAILMLTTSACSESPTGSAGGGRAELDARNSRVAAVPLAVTPCPASTGALVTIAGAVTYDFVPHLANSFGLNYGAIRKKPARGVTVQALNTASNAVIATAISTNRGRYSLQVPDNRNVTIRVLAELVQATLPSSNFRAVDNTAGNAQWAMQGGQGCSGTTKKTRNLNAASGWGGSSYTGSRIAAPFAILDDVYDAVTLIRSSAPTTDFPALDLYWSPNNVPAGNNSAIGQIGTSYYDGTGIYLLGSADSDTDEYDRHVILHEFGHYIEAQFSRSDSIGGEHPADDRLDMRVAFGEGFGTAFSAMVSGDPNYRDAVGPGQSLGSGFSLETNPTTNTGWYSEGSVQAILYDLFDTASDGADTLSLGFAPIYNVFVNQERTSQAFTSIFTFISALKANNAGQAAAIDQLVSSQGIVSGTMDAYGTTETNTGGLAGGALPVYATLTVGAPITNLCTDTIVGLPNKLGNRRFVRLNIAAIANHTITVTGNGAAVDPDFYLYQNGVQLQIADGSGVSDSLVRDFSAGDFVMEVFDYNLLFGTGVGPSCFSVVIN